MKKITNLFIKHFMVWLLALASHFSFSQSIVVGTGTKKERYPFNYYWGFGSSAILYKHNEIGNIAEDKQIKSIQFYTTGTLSANALSNTKIYIKIVDNTVNGVPVVNWATQKQNAQEIYSGVPTFVEGGWTVFNLTTPITIQPNKNLMILVETAYGGLGNGVGEDESAIFLSHHTQGHHLHRAYQKDNTPFDSPNSEYEGHNSPYRPNLKIKYEEGSCESAEVSDMTVSNIGMTNATLNLAGASDTNVFQVQFGLHNFALGTANTMTITSPTHAFNNLTPSTAYTVYVRRKCSDTEFSSWHKIDFSTLTPNVIEQPGVYNVKNLPIRVYMKYSYSQQILDKNLVAQFVGSGPKIITYLKFQRVIAGTFDASKIGKVKSWEVYLGTTTKQEFQSNEPTQFIPLANLTKVFDGDIEISEDSDWVNIQFPQGSEYMYSGTENLVIAVREKSPGYISIATDDFDIHWKAFPTQKHTALLYYSDTVVVGPESLGVASSQRHQLKLLNKVHIGTIEPNCENPATVSQTELTDTSVKFSWTAPNSATPIAYKWFLFTKDANPAVATPVQSGQVTGLEVEINNLASNTEYDFYVKSKCNDVVEGQYENKKAFTTKCGKILTIQVSEIMASSVKFSWTAVAGASNYEWKIFSKDADPTTATPLFMGETNNAFKVVSGLSGSTEYDFYVRVKCSATNFGDLSQKTTVETPCNLAPPMANAQTFCGQTFVSNLQVANTPELGVTYKWYATETSTQSLLGTIEVSTGTYYVSKVQGSCESSKTPVQVVVKITPVPAAASYDLCQGSMVSDLTIQNTTPQETYKWYDSETSNTVLTPQTVLASGTYYLTRTVDGCESLRTAIPVNIKPLPSILPVSNVSLCNDVALVNISVGATPGNTVKWYQSMSATTALPDTTLAQTGVYYVSQLGTNGCESLRKPINVTVGYVSVPSTESLQTFCGTATAADLVVFEVAGDTYNWYDSFTSTTPLAATTPLHTGNYYVTRVITGGCESAKRLVAVKVMDKTAPNYNPLSVCDGTKISDVKLSSTVGVQNKWYATNTSINALSEDTVLTSGTYYVTRIISDCESNRTAVEVTVNGIPNAPTGAALQSFVINNNEVKRIADLVTNEDNVLWFATQQDAKNNVNKLLPNTPLTNNAKYYGVLINESGCVSEPMEVTVTITLGNNGFDLSELRYYPNPVQSELNISYKEAISKVEVFNTLGQMVKKQNFESVEISVDFNELPSGTYFVKVYTQNKSQLIQVVKK